MTSSHSAAPRRLSSTRSAIEPQCSRSPCDAQAVGDVVEDRLGEGIGFLEHHADLAAQLDHVHVLAVDVLAVEQHLPFDPRAGDDVVHPVERAQEGGFAAAGRADEGRDPVPFHVQEMDVRAW